MSKKLRDQIYIDQKSDGDIIRRIVQKNHGYLRTEAFSYIKVTSVLIDYANTLNQVNNSQETGLVDCELAKGSTYHVGITYEGHSLKYAFRSPNVIEAFEYPLKRVSRGQVQLLLANNGDLVDNASKSEALRYGQSFVESKGLSRTTISYSDFVSYVHRIETGLDDKDKTRVTRQRFNNIIKKQVVFVYQQQFVLFSTNSLVEQGQKVFEARFCNQPAPDMPVTVVSKSDALQFIFRNYDAKYSK